MVLAGGSEEVFLPIRLKKADSFRTRLKGLMFRRQPLEGEGLWLYPCNSIHMFFMSFAIDVVFLDRDLRVVKTVEASQPWSVVWPVRNACHALELPVGTIEKYGIHVGKRITPS